MSTSQAIGFAAGRAIWPCSRADRAFRLPCGQEPRRLGPVDNGGSLSVRLVRRARVWLIPALVWTVSAAATSAQGVDGAMLARLVGAGDIAQARQVLAAASPSRIDEEFLAGLELKAQGRLPQAIGTFRGILAADPDHLNARRELAHTLYLARDFGAARAEFRRLMQIDPTPAMQARYGAFLRNIGSERPVALTGYLSLQRSSNATRGTTNATIDTVLGALPLDPGTRARAETGVQAGLAGHARLAASPAAEFRIEVQADMARHADRSLDWARGRVALALHETGPGHMLRFAPYLLTRHDEIGGSYRAPGFELAVSQTVGARTRVGVAFSAETRRFEDAPGRDGPAQALILTLSHRIDAHLTVHAGLGTTAERPELGHLRHDGRRVFLGLSRGWPSGLTTDLLLERGRRDFENDFPFMTAPRKDDYASVRLGVTAPGWAVLGYVPRVSCTRTVHVSNVALYDFSATDCSAGWQRQF